MSPYELMTNLHLYENEFIDRVVVGRGEKGREKRESTINIISGVFQSTQYFAAPSLVENY